MQQRLDAGEPVVSGFSQEGKLLFPTKAQVIAEPTAVFDGELSSPEDMKRSNKEVRATLTSLAKQLKSELHQQSVFVSYRDEHWCV